MNSLKILKLNKNQITKTGIIPLMNSLGSKMCKIETLDLTSTGFCDNCAPAFCKSLQTNFSLTRLYA